jgi:3-hydroxyacyl-CoA dehydrogenase
VADALGKLVLTSSGEAALATADLVVEAITENLPLKQEHRDHLLWNFFCMEFYEVDLSS